MCFWFDKSVLWLLLHWKGDSPRRESAVPGRGIRDIDLTLIMRSIPPSDWECCRSGSHTVNCVTEVSHFAGQEETLLNVKLRSETAEWGNREYHQWSFCQLSKYRNWSTVLVFQAHLMLQEIWSEMILKEEAAVSQLYHVKSHNKSADYFLYNLNVIAKELRCWFPTTTIETFFLVVSGGNIPGSDNHDPIILLAQWSGSIVQPLVLAKFRPKSSLFVFVFASLNKFYNYFASQLIQQQYLWDQSFRFPRWHQILLLLTLFCSRVLHLTHLTMKHQFWVCLHVCIGSNNL